MEIKKAVEKEDFLFCWEVVRELRPHLNPDSYLALIPAMLDEGYSLIYVKEENKALAFCGYRPITLLYNGRGFYIDDLATLPEARGKGYASALLDHVFAEAKARGFDNVTLDSGHQRFPAHRLYLNKGFNMVGHHFEKKMH